MSIACGLFALWIFRHTSDLGAVQTSMKRVHAHLLEFRLFYDEPQLIWRAQKVIIRENLRILLLIARPAIILTLPMAWLLIQFDAIYGYAPLLMTAPSVITAQMNGKMPEDFSATLQAPPEIAVETPAVRSTADRQISWRIRPLRPVHGIVRLASANFALDKTIAAGTRPAFLVRKRVHSLFDFLLRPEEARLPACGIDWVEVDYPKADVVIAGIALPWLAWFAVISTASALVFARSFRSSR